MSSLHANDPKLTAYALGELDEPDLSAVETHLANSPEGRQAVKDIREVAALLTTELGKEPAPQLGELERLTVAAAPPVVSRRGSRQWIVWAIAASLLAAVLAPFFYQKIADYGDPQTRVAENKPSARKPRPPKQAPADQTPGTDVSPETTTPEPTDAGTESVAQKDEMPAGDSTAVVEGTTSEQPTEAADKTDAAPVATKVASPRRRGKSEPILVDDVSWIDSLVAQAWQENNVKPSQAATDGEFVRRAYLDIVGHVPPADKAAGYIASRDKDKKARLIVELLDSENYAKNWATIWTNQLIGRQPARNADRDDREGLTKYLRDSFTENKPWKQISYELIAASGGSNRDAVGRGVAFNGAANFLLAHMNDGNVPATAFTTRLFLGVQVQCTQCHDHPFNDRTQEAFWGINAFFQQMRRVEHNDEDPDTGQRRRVFTELREQSLGGGEDMFVRYDKRNALVAVTPPKLLDGREFLDAAPDLNLREELARYITSPDNEYFAKAIVNRMWAHFLGRGIVHPMDDMGEHNPPSNPELLDQLAGNFKESNYDLKRLITWITLSAPYGLSSQTNASNREDDTYFSHYPLKQLSPEQVFDSLIVATRATRGANWESEARLREELLNQFTISYQNDENTEADTFNGTVPQALFLMNGPLMAKAVSTEPGSYLHESVTEIDQLVARRKVRSVDEARRKLLEELYLAALSRFPSKKEESLAAELLGATLAQGNAKPVDAFQDVFWALLNSNEFVLNH